MNSLVYRTLFYVNIYGSYKLSKTVRFFGPPFSYNTLLCIAAFWQLLIMIEYQSINQKIREFSLSYTAILVSTVDHVTILV